MDHDWLPENTSMKTYFTFGQAHIHKINKTILDHNIVLEVTGESENACREIVFNLIGPKWAFSYPETPPNMEYFPRGIINIEDL